MSEAGAPARPPGAATGGLERLRPAAGRACALALPLFVLVEVNYPLMGPLAELAVFALLGLALCFLAPPAAGRRRMALDLLLAAATALVFGYVLVQSMPLFSGWWSDGQSLGSRAGAETTLDLVIGGLGLLLVLEASRRTVGWALPILSLVFIAYARFGSLLPDWLLPHRGYDLGRIVSQSFLHSQGVFGVALRVMFSYVFLFVVFGALLEATGATRFIVDAGRRLFGGATGGPAKIAVFSSGLMGSLSGSAVANTATTGTFTIPLMRSAGFSRHVAAGVEAAASSGGALVPPVMGAGAYMMLEIVSPPVTYLEIIRAALVPALLYYLSIFLIVHFHALAHASGPPDPQFAGEGKGLARYEGVVFVGALGSLVAFLGAGFSVFRAVTAALAVVLVLGTLHPRTRLGARRLLAALAEASRAGVPLVAAAACVGIVIGIVTLTGAGSRLPAILLPLAQESLGLALVMIMVSSIILGMGLPSAVCYLLLATLIGPALGRLGVVPLAAHFFIFYFGMMSMVTPPVALAAYAASSIAGSRFLESSVAAFRFAIVGFTLPYMFVFRPQLLMLGESASPGGVALAVALAVLGIVPLAAALGGHLLRPLSPAERGALLLAALMGLYPGSDLAVGWDVSWLNLVGVALFAGVLAAQWRAARRASGSAAT